MTSGYEPHNIVIKHRGKIMNCVRENCECLIAEGKGYILNDKIYCNETCATQCTDDECVCTPCDCLN